MPVPPFELDRRQLLRMSLTFTAASVLPSFVRRAGAQAGYTHDKIDQARASAANTPVQTTPLSKQLFLLQGVGGNILLQTGRDGNVLVDSGYSTGVPRLRAAIKELDKPAAGPPGTLINTHWHYDHTDGNEGMHQAGYAIYGHQATRRRMAAPQTVNVFNVAVPASPEAALPTATFTDRMEFWRNDEAIELEHFAPAHTDSDIYVYFRKADVLHVGDTFFNAFYPFIDENSGGRIDGMIHANDKALALAGANTRIVPGHGGLATKAQLQAFRDMLAGIRDKIGSLKSSGTSEADVVAQKPTAAWDGVWGKGFLTTDQFAALVYRTV